jgi:cold shock CspA family protein
MIKGTISKLVHTFGSHWGRIRPAGESREVFFNPSCLDDPDDFGSMTVGQEVEFLEEMDRANGTHAIHVSTAPSGDQNGHRGAGSRQFRATAAADLHGIG